MDEENYMQVLEDGIHKIRVEENCIRDYKCLEFILYELEERKIEKPWEKG